MDNMQTLCVPCHLEKSKGEARERAVERRGEREKEQREKGDRWKKVRELVANETKME
jgi:hypothetical protein